ncbi:MAG: 5-(carboxyamino)imidazole ribonucleotide synthase, partial [Thermodesulfobacteriota bacterium]
PAPEIIALIQNKGQQKQFYASKNLPTADFKIFRNKELILKSIELGELKFPFVQKLCKHGYDGRGVLIIKNKSDAKKLLDGESLVEKLIDIKKEISVITAQNKRGEVRSFPPVDMVFNSKANLVELLICPSSLSNEFQREAISLAEKTIKLLGLCGILAVEMFIDIEDNILINEVAPRPHNSGHHTIEASYTSQYEQCLRAILDLPLGNTDMKVPSVMVNILGDPDYEGKAFYEGLEDCMKIEGANFHIYGKNETKPYRKMGHVTVLDKELSSAKEKAMFIKKNLRVMANE